LGNMLFALDKIKEAIIEYKKAISLNPLDSDFYRNLGIAYISTGEISKAKEILSNNPSNRVGTAIARLGHIRCRIS
ncbi:MAG: tetratricopeptide repeat protein, partial [Proteobacteria bacterium]|nr:tetratricopeptide repeat protein [Pseudomonadota bacterium]